MGWYCAGLIDHARNAGLGGPERRTRGRRTATAAFSATASACWNRLPAHTRRRGDGEPSGGGDDDPAGRHRSVSGFAPPPPGTRHGRTPAAAGGHFPGQRQQNALETCARSMWRRRVRSTRGFMVREFSRCPPGWSRSSRAGLALRTRRTSPPLRDTLTPPSGSQEREGTPTRSGVIAPQAAGLLAAARTAWRLPPHRHPRLGRLPPGRPGTGLPGGRGPGSA